MLDQARTLFQQHQFDDCLALCRDLLSTQQDNYAVLALLSATLLLRAESTLDRAEGLAVLQQLKQQLPDLLAPIVAADLSAAYLFAGEINSAEQCLRSALGKIENEPSCLSENTELSCRTKVRPTFNKIYRRSGFSPKKKYILGQAPSVASLLLARLGMVLMQSGRYQEALDATQKSLQIAPNIVAIQVNQARLLARLGHFSRAETILEQLPPPQPSTHPALLEGRLEIHLLAKKNDDAQQLIDGLLAAISVDASSKSKQPLEESVQTQKYYFKLLNIRASFAIAEEAYADAEMYLRRGLVLKDDERTLVRGLADLCDLQGRYSESTRLFLKLSRCYKDEPTILLSLANAYIQQHQMGLALKALEGATDTAEALNDASLDAQILTIRARIEQDTSTDAALESYHSALALDSNCLVARLGLGHLYLLLGRSDEAIEQFNLVSDHSLSAGFSSLASVRQFPKDEAVLKQIENSVILPIWSGASGVQVQIRTLFALAEARQSQKEYPAAFKWALEANRKIKQNLKWDNEETEDLTQRLMRTFNCDFFHQREKFGSPSNVPVFVLGMPRSGTTLMEQMLGNHSAFFAAGELGLVASRAHSLSRWEAHIGSGQSYPECVAGLSSNEIATMAEQHIASLRELANPTVQHIIDKLPHNFQHIGLIHLLFPKAKIIYCRRHANAIALSNFFTHYQAAHHGMGFAYSLEDLGEHIAAHQALMRHWDSVLPGVIHTVDYEAVVDDPETHIRAILSWMGLDWEDSVLQHTQLKRAVKTASVWQVRQPVYSSSKEKWRHYAQELIPFEKALARSQQYWQNRSNQIMPNPESCTSLSTELGRIFSNAIDHHRGELHQAEQGYRQVLQQNPKHSGALYLLAGVAYQAGHFAPARTLYEQVAQHYRHLAAFHYNYGLTLFALHEYAKAKLAFEQALVHKADYADAQSLLDEVISRSDFSPTRYE